MRRKTALIRAVLGAACLTALAAGGCATNEDNGTTRTEKTRVEDGPDGKTTTTTKTEKKVEDYPR